jgi:hypothetical protein
MTDRHTHPVPDPEPPPHRRGEQEPPHRDDAPPRRPARSHEDDRDEDDPGRRDARQPGPTPRVAAPVTSTSGPRYDAASNQYVRSDVGGTYSYTGDGALPVASGVHKIMKTSIAALSLANPTAGDEGVLMVITAGTAFAHFVQLAEGIGGKGGVGGAFDVISFAAVGDTISLRAVNSHWVPEGAPYGAVIS